MAFSTYLANDTLNDKFAGTLYLALFTSNPTAAGSGTEASGGSYARQAITFTTSTVATIASEAEIVFTVNIANYTHYGIFDASTGGNMLDYEELNNGSGINVTANDTDITFAAGDIAITLTTSI